MRPFLLFMIRTHPLQMKEYLLQYASTDKKKKKKKKNPTSITVGPIHHFELVK